MRKTRCHIILSHKGGFFFFFFLVMKSTLIANTEGSHSSSGALKPRDAAPGPQTPKARHKEGAHPAAGTKPMVPAWPSALVSSTKTPTNLCLALVSPLQSGDNVGAEESRCRCVGIPLRTLAFAHPWPMERRAAFVQRHWCCITSHPRKQIQKGRKSSTHPAPLHLSQLSQTQLRHDSGSWPRSPPAESRATHSCDPTGILL